MERPFDPILVEVIRNQIAAITEEMTLTVYRTGRSLARQIRMADGRRRFVVAARRDPETGETYGVATHLRPIEPPARPT